DTTAGRAGEGTMRNLELKVRCRDERDLDAMAARAAAGGAAFVRALGQRDTYFAAPRGRLKLREWWREPAPEGAPAPVAADAGDEFEAAPAGAALIAYARPDDAGSRLSDYLICPVAEAGPLRAALARSVGTRVVVEKRRVLYRYGRTRIHLDRVAGLGAFVELETLLDGEDEAGPDALAEHRAVIALLGLDRLPAVAGSYADLLAESAPGRPGADGQASDER
ncbi:MAG TPA: class IV adenylate cyclase, partial [Thermomicrobiales bacterium]|nr:class IV adenylate cyclase [Thermomicrobiales bacterium]